MKITVDDKDFLEKITEFTKQTDNKRRDGVRNVANEILRISQFKVPHNVGTLQNSGFVQDQDDDAIVGYNTVYAARLHEHPEYRFKGAPTRGGKYLENAIKENLTVLREYLKQTLGF